MKVAIHQMNYFPWIGYFDKMAKVDKFIFLDEVQLEKGSNMLRNRLMSKNGEVKYITIPCNKKEYLNKKYNEILINDKIDWKKRIINFIKDNYKRSNYFDEVFPIIDNHLKKDYKYLYEVVLDSIILIKNLLEINTELVLQSDIDYNNDNKKSDLVLELCKKTNATIYFSGRGGSVKYLNQSEFFKNNIKIIFQEYEHINYNQINSEKFVEGISILDMLFNCGLEGFKSKFWENII